MITRVLLCALVVLTLAHAQVYSPLVLKRGEMNASDLHALTRRIYDQADANTPREKAEAIWRFFLTDGRFVKPGFWYHIAGWAYEEPLGEVLDPIKLMNSYGFGLCYHIAPLLAAVYDAGGFEDARVWFLTGHTVAEVFYDGGYHYFDSDMMGYNAVGTGPLKKRRVVSVHDLEQNGSIVLSKVVGPKQADTAAVDDPWYPADVRANAMGDLTSLFTTTADNWVYPFKRYPQGHRMNFVLRPGERMTRYYRPESEHLFYLPFKFDGTAWREFPQEIAEYHIETKDGPRSQKDVRLWATGKIEYQPPVVSDEATLVYDVPCPYVIIDAQFALDANLQEHGDKLSVATSVDGGRTWTNGQPLDGPFHGRWQTAPAIIATSEHGKLTAVSGMYGYQVRFTREGHARMSDVVLTTRFELNPRTLPELTGGKNEMQYSASAETRTEIPVRADKVDQFASTTRNVRYVSEAGQGYVVNANTEPAQLTFELDPHSGSTLEAFDVGGRFLDLREGLAPDKFTAEVRKVTPWPAANVAPKAEIAWAERAEGHYRTIWTYNDKLTWKDGQAIDRTLRWPEVDRHVVVSSGSTHVWVRYTVQGMAIDDFRLASIEPAAKSSPLVVTHLWNENGIPHRFVQRIDAGARKAEYNVGVPEGVAISNEAIVMECPLDR